MAKTIEELSIQVEKLRNVMSEYVTNYELSKQPAENMRLRKRYEELRSELLESTIAWQLPRSVKTHETLTSFDQSMKSLGGYAARRKFLEDEFEPLLQRLKTDSGSDQLSPQMDPVRISEGEQSLSTSLQIEPVFGFPKDDDQFRCDVFVIMPFKQEFDAIFTDVIQPVGKELGLQVIRGDDFHSAYHIIDEIWSAMYYSRIVVADCTGNNPNVFYELGMAHTLGKPTILLTQDVDSTPFDVQSRRLIHYSDSIPGSTKLKGDLKKAIKKFLPDRS